MKLTDAQKQALETFTDGLRHESWGRLLHPRRLKMLWDIGLLVSDGNGGFYITPAGRAVLEEAERYGVAIDSKVYHRVGQTWGLEGDGFSPACGYTALWGPVTDTPPPDTSPCKRCFPGKEKP